VRVHRDSHFWDNPGEFDSERFTPEKSKRRGRYEYYPFLGGPHQCLGRDFVLLEAQLALILTYQRFHLELKPGHAAEAEPLVTQRMRGSLPMSIQRR
jgi:cytochrome P450